MKNKNIHALGIILLLMVSLPLWADEVRPAYLQLTEVQPNVFSVLWKVPARSDNQRLALNVSFDAEHTTLGSPMEGFVGGYYLRNWQASFANGLPRLKITIEGLEQTSTEVLLRVEYQDGISLTHRFGSAAPEYVVPEKPTLLQTAYSYLTMGIEHILLGFDHLLFVLALLLLIDNTRKLILTITFFTIAHSITLTLATLQIIHIPVPPVEAMIALSIVFVASEIVRTQHGHVGITYRKPWVVSFSFGLLHGLGFAAALGAIGLPQNAIPTALVLFNVGVEIGQLLFIASVLAVISLLKRIHWQAGQGWQRLPPYAIGSLASFWVIERVSGFWG